MYSFYPHLEDTGFLFYFILSFLLLKMSISVIKDELGGFLMFS